MDASAELTALARHTDLLRRTATHLDDPGAPSRCAGWSRGHVLTHLARNAEGMARLVRSAVDGTGETMYRSPEGRDEDIEAGAGRSVAELAEDVDQSAHELAAALPRLADADPQTPVERVPGGPTFRAGALVGMRLREVVYHHADLEAGFDFAQVEPDLLIAYAGDELDRVWAEGGVSLVVETTEGDTWTRGTGGPTVTGSRAAVLGWLARGLTDGVTGSLPELPKGR